MWNSFLYGNYRNNKFGDVYPDVETFQADYEEFNKGILDNKFQFPETVKTLWLLLAARYGDSTIASANEDQFKLKLFSTIFMYGPTWEKRLDVQKQIRALDIDDLRQGGKAIYNSALNPSNAVYDASGEYKGGTNTMEELKYINQQNTTNYKKSLPEAYAIMIELLNTDVTSRFLSQFKKLFLTVVSPEVPLWYITDRTDPEVEDDD